MNFLGVSCKSSNSPPPGVLGNTQKTNKQTKKKNEQTNCYKRPGTGVEWFCHKQADCFRPNVLWTQNCHGIVMTVLMESTADVGEECVSATPSSLSFRFVLCDGVVSSLWGTQRDASLKTSGMIKPGPLQIKLLNLKKGRFSCFRSAVEDKLYQFEFALYEMIQPKSKQMNITPKQVEIGFLKKNRGRWPRLLKEKKKVCVCFWIHSCSSFSSW